VSSAPPRAQYERRINELAQELAAGEQRHLHIANFRLVLFAAAAAILWLSLSRELLSPGWVLVPGVLFLVLIVVHARVLTANERIVRARRYYERGLSRIDGTWSGSGPDGAAFIGEHPYARDLDLFGAGSLFQLIDTARTEAGEATLAEWLRTPADSSEVRERQAAVAELRDRAEFREALAVLAAEAHVSRTGALAAWAMSSPIGVGRQAAVLFGACAAANAVVVTLLFMGTLPGVAAFAWLCLTGAIAFLNRKRVWQVLQRVDAAAHDLALLETLLARLERESFDSPRLRQIHATLEGEHRPSALVAQLRRFIAVRDLPRNEFARPFALVLFARSQAAAAIDGWHQHHRGTLASWIAAVGDFEALASLATYAYEHPADAFPEIVDGRPVFNAIGLAHPLLHEGVAVRNDVALGGDAAQVLLVSGSNMSGKSTLLRAVGTNAVLALAGAPVRATRLRLSPLAVGASVRVEDSLQQGHSRFYTEILKIKHILELTSGARPVLFLLDEILHGTNSHDRRIGAEAIVRSLLDAGAIGLVTTHDLALARLADGADGRARNVHFEDHVENGRMVFDYRMREGVVERSNALELMRAVGIDV
jgi:hypothetical protein